MAQLQSLHHGSVIVNIAESDAKCAGVPGKARVPGRPGLPSKQYKVTHGSIPRAEGKQTKTKAGLESSVVKVLATRT